MLTLRTRRIIAITFIVAFLITAPILILYTAGYRYSFKKQKVSLTGTLVLASTPKNATVRLNTNDDTTTTPVRLTNLFPNEYHITISKNGYSTWEKTLPVYSQKTTFAENVVLFKNSQPQTMAEKNITNPILSPDRSMMAGIVPATTTTHAAVEIFTGKKLLTVTTASSPKSFFSELQWSADSQYISVIEHAESTNTVRIFSIDSSGGDVIATTQLPNLSAIRWDAQHGRTFYFQTKQTVAKATIKLDWQLVEDPLNIENLYTFAETQTIQDWLVADNTLFYIEKTPTSLFLTKRELSGLIIPSMYPTIELPVTASYVFRHSIANHLVIENTTNHTSNLLNTALDTSTFERRDLLGYDLIEKHRLLIFDSSEIALLDLASSHPSASTVTRVSDGITYAQWYHDPNYVFFVQNGVMALIELDQRDVRNVTTLAPQNVTFAYLTTDGRYVYYMTKDKPGIFRLEIQD